MGFVDFLGAEPNLGFWPATPAGSCCPWSRHHNGQLLTEHRTALHFCSLPETLHQLHTFSQAYGWRSATHLTCVATASCCRMGWWVRLPRGDRYSAIISLSEKHNTAQPAPLHYLKRTLCVRVFLQILARQHHSWMDRSFPLYYTVTNWE